MINLTEDQKKRIAEAITSKVNEHIEKGMNLDDFAKVVVPEMIAVAIEEYEKSKHTKKEKSNPVTAMAELLQKQVKILADWNDTFSVGAPSIEYVEQIRENAKLIMEITVYLVALSNSSTDISRAIQSTTKNYLENLAERGVLTESSQATPDSTQETP